MPFYYTNVERVNNLHPVLTTRQSVGVFTTRLSVSVFITRESVGVFTKRQSVGVFTTRDSRLVCSLHDSELVCSLHDCQLLCSLHDSQLELGPYTSASSKLETVETRRHRRERLVSCTANAELHFSLNAFRYACNLHALSYKFSSGLVSAFAFRRPVFPAFPIGASKWQAHMVRRAFLSCSTIKRIRTGSKLDELRRRYSINVDNNY